jgi:hypothetical protein
VAIVDQDRSAISKQILAGAETDKSLKVTTPSEDEARDLVKRGTTTVSGAAMPVLVLTAFAALFWTIAASRFRWDEA